MNTVFLTQEISKEERGIFEEDASYEVAADCYCTASESNYGWDARFLLGKLICRFWTIHQLWFLTKLLSSI